MSRNYDVDDNIFLRVINIYVKRTQTLASDWSKSFLLRVLEIWGKEHFCLGIKIDDACCFFVIRILTYHHGFNSIEAYKRNRAFN